MDKADGRFFPFYERLSGRFPGHDVGKIIISVSLGSAFLAAHYATLEGEVFQNWSWFLAALISTAMLCVYYATHTLRSLIPEVEARVYPDGKGVYEASLKRILSDRNFVLSGLFFGSLNCAFGTSFGLPYSSGPAAAALLGGYFLAGFVCGIAVLGIFGVSVAIRKFSQNAELDFTSPDRCAGTLFLGESLVIFSSVTVIIGVMISVYILQAKWTEENVGWVLLLKVLWIGFPYVMSLLALILPAVPLNKALREYKNHQGVALRERLAEIFKQLEADGLHADVRKELRADYEFEARRREELHKMRTWPFGLRANLKYLAVLVGNLLASVANAAKWLKDMLSPSGG